MTEQQFTVVIKRKIPLNDVFSSFEQNNIKILKTIKNMDSTFVVSCEKEALDKVTGILALHDETQKLPFNVCNWNINRTVTKYLPLREEFDPLFNGEGTTVYVADSGIKRDHSEFVDANIVLLYSMFDTFEDNLGHGTPMVSLIVGKTCGISPKAIVKVVKVLDQNNQETLLSELLVALDKILEDHLVTANITKVVNMSWTIPKNPLLDYKIAEMRDKNLFIVCAAGNDGGDVNNFSPAGIDVITTVGASDIYDRITSFTNLPHENVAGAENNLGPALDIFAPGIDAVVGYANGEIGVSSGTSISAAIVSAAACHYIQQDFSASSEVIKDRILSESTKDCIYFGEKQSDSLSNKLIFIPCVYYKDMWNTPSGRIVNVKIGTGVYEEILDVSDEITEITVSLYSKLPNFISLDGKKLLIDSNTTDGERVYHFLLIAKNNLGYEYPKGFSVGLYNNKETDLETAEEVYTGEDGSYYSTYISAATTKP